VQRLWYVAYGTNLSIGRLRCYLRGGRLPDVARQYQGCRDQRDPAATFGTLVPGGIYFTGHSTVWGGGMAVYDADHPGWVAARAYLLTASQFGDVLAQEMRQHPGVEVDLTPVHRLGRYTYGPGRYQTLLRVGSRSGLPMLTFTSGQHACRTLSAPTAAYLRTMAVGLRESHGWSNGQIGAHLASIPGAHGTWTSDEIAALGGQPHHNETRLARRRAEEDGAEALLSARDDE
jgi:hypothetical protein